MLSSEIFAHFSSEIRKHAAMPPKLKGGLLKGIKLEHLLAAGAGAGGLYGANRLYKDIQVGEQVRKQQKGY